MSPVATKRSAGAHVPQDFSDHNNYDNWWDNINLHGLNIPDHHYDGSNSLHRSYDRHYDGSDCLHPHDLSPPIPIRHFWPSDYNYNDDYGYDYGTHPVYARIKGQAKRAKYSVAIAEEDWLEANVAS